MAAPPKPDDLKRKQEAESLQQQIDDLASGASRPGKPASFREFIEQKMAEDRAKAEEEPPPQPDQPPESKPDR